MRQVLRQALGNLEGASAVDSGNIVVGEVRQESSSLGARFLVEVGDLGAKLLVVHARVINAHPGVLDRRLHHIRLAAGVTGDIIIAVCNLRDIMILLHE